MNDFLKNLRDSLETGSLNQNSIDKLNEINGINKLVVEKYGDEKSGEKMSRQDLSRLEEKVDNLVGEKKVANEKDLLDALEALGNNIVVDKANKLEDDMNNVMRKISEDNYLNISGSLYNEFGVKYKEIDDIVLDDFKVEEANHILSQICLFELEYSDFIENNVFYNDEILTIKNDLIKILKK